MSHLFPAPQHYRLPAGGIYILYGEKMEKHTTGKSAFTLILVGLAIVVVTPVIFIIAAIKRRL